MQNIDGLHIKAGSTDVVELHGSLWKTRCCHCKAVETNTDMPICPALDGKVHLYHNTKFHFLILESLHGPLLLPHFLLHMRYPWPWLVILHEIGCVFLCQISTISRNLHQFPFHHPSFSWVFPFFVRKQRALVTRLESIYLSLEGGVNRAVTVDVMYDGHKRWRIGQQILHSR